MKYPWLGVCSSEVVIVFATRSDVDNWASCIIHFELKLYTDDDNSEKDLTGLWRGSAEILDMVYKMSNMPQM